MQPAGGINNPGDADRPRRPLFPCECRVVQLAAQGKPNKIIAHELGLSEGTVKQYLRGAFRVLGFGSRYELMAWWLRVRSAEPDGASDTSLEAMIDRLPPQFRPRRSTRNT